MNKLHVVHFSIAFVVAFVWSQLSASQIDTQSAEAHHASQVEISVADAAD